MERQIKLTNKTWKNIKYRCYNKNHPRYHKYGGRGIKLASCWQDFNNFLIDLGPQPLNHFLMRIDLDKDYEPGNCVWGIKTGKAAINSYLVHKVKYAGIEMSLGELSNITQIPTGRLHNRIVKMKWSVEKAISINKLQFNTPKAIIFRNQIFGVKDFAIFIGVHYWTVKNWIRQGKDIHKMAIIHLTKQRLNDKVNL